MPLVAQIPLQQVSPLTVTPLKPLESEGADTMKLDMLDGAVKAAMKDWPL